MVQTIAKIIENLMDSTSPQKDKFWRKFQLKNIWKKLNAVALSFC